MTEIKALTKKNKNVKEQDLNYLVKEIETYMVKIK